MANKVKFSALAQRDLEKSSKWYEDHRTGLGEIFCRSDISNNQINLKKPYCLSGQKNKHQRIFPKEVSVYHRLPIQ
jgi:hypothetical protein